MARAARGMARNRRAIRIYAVIAVDGRVLGRFGTVRLLTIWISTPRGATEWSFKRWHNDFTLLIDRASAQISILRRAIELQRALKSAQRGNFFRAEENFCQKRVAQFRQLRTTNHQVTSVFTHFKFQLVNTRTFDSVAMRDVSYRSYLGLVASFPG